MPNTKYKTLNNTVLADYSSSPNYYAIQMKDKTTLVIRGKNDGNKGINFVYYTKGKKGENTLGKDMFVFSIIPSDKRNITPYSENPGKVSLKEASENNCINSGASGSECTAWIIGKGNMDYLDCPGTLTWEKGTCK